MTKFLLSRTLIYRARDLDIDIAFYIWLGTICSFYELLIEIFRKVAYEGVYSGTPDKLRIIFANGLRRRIYWQ
jgi:hypothetical protein